VAVRIAAALLRGDARGYGMGSQTSLADRRSRFRDGIVVLEPWRVRSALGLAIVLLACGFAGPSLAARIEVGSQRTLKLPSDAEKIARDGDTVAIDPGTYFDCVVWSANHLTISGTGGLVVISDKICQGKGIFVIQGDDTTVQSITFTRARDVDGNGAGIRLEGRNLTVEDSRFINNESGILANDSLGSVITIINSEFVDNGSCQLGCAHALGVGRIGLLRLLKSRFSATKLAHNISSAALRNELTDDFIEDGPDGTSSYLVDLPIGGTLLLSNNVLEKGPRTSNASAAIMIGGGATLQPTKELIVTGNRFANDTGRVASFLVNWTSTLPVLDKNTFVGDVTPVSTSGSWVHRMRVVAGEMKSEIRAMAVNVVHLIRRVLAQIGLRPM